MLCAPQGSASHSLRVIKFVPGLALSLLLATTGLDITSASTQGEQQKAELAKNCECKFDTKDYEAYGTNAACGIAMSNKSHTCEIAFSGTGANTKILTRILGEAAAQNQLAMAPEIFQRYVAYARGGEKDRKIFADASFIEKSLVVLERAALFRETAVRAKLPLEVIDKLFVEFSKNNSDRVAKTFAGADPFTVEQGEDTFFIGQGYVELNFHKIATVRVVYFYEQPR